MTPDADPCGALTFKQRKSFANRKEEVAGIRAKFPTKIPVIVERYRHESHLPVLEKMKFLVPDELTVSQFVTIIRGRLHLHATQAFYLMVNNRSMANLSKTLGEVYREHRDDDGFLYVTYASQEMFGRKTSIQHRRTEVRVRSAAKCHPGSGVGPITPRLFLLPRLCHSTIENKP